MTSFPCNLTLVACFNFFFLSFFLSLILGYSIIWNMKHTLGDMNLIDCDLNESSVGGGEGKLALGEVGGALACVETFRGTEII
jgi:hypothetical protein